MRDSTIDINQDLIRLKEAMSKRYKSCEEFTD